MNTAYTKQVTYTFEVDGEIWEVLDFDESTIEFGETEKNGQEDSHVYGRAELVDGRWQCDDSTVRTLKCERSASTAEALNAFFNAHSTPSAK